MILFQVICELNFRCLQSFSAVIFRFKVYLKRVQVLRFRIRVMSSVQQPSPQCIYVPTKYASVYYNEECSLLLCRREAEESEYYVNDGSIISDTTESFDCNEMLHKPEEGAPQVSSPVWDHSTCRDEYFTDPHNLSEESLLSLHYSYGLEDSSNISYLYAWLSSLDQETEEHYYSMTRIQLREMHLREKIFMQKPEEAVNPNYMTYRHFLVEWISDVCMELVLTPETLHTAVYLLDSFMSKQKLDHHFLQALSCACILVAGKFCLFSVLQWGQLMMI